MINDEANNCYYFAVKNLPELNSLVWLRSKKEAIINGDNDFHKCFRWCIKLSKYWKRPAKISKLKLYITKYNWEGIELPAGAKDWIKFERNDKTIALIILLVKRNTKKISVAYRTEYNNKRKK